MATKKTNKKLFKSLTALGLFAAGLLSYPLLTKNIPAYKNNHYPFSSTTKSIPQTNTDTTKSDIEKLGVCFTPNQACFPKILQYIDNAQSSILLLGYSFTSKPLTDALIKAKNRGVNVRIVLDHSQKSQKASKEPIEALIKNQIEIRFDHSVKIAHNKVIIIDNNQTITGSYNWSHSAEFNNAENLIFIQSQEVTKKYTDYFEGRWNISKPDYNKKVNYKKSHKAVKVKKNSLIGYLKSP
ncbi:MAG: phospholipase D family protein [Proteobacteria bacterium]|nr:phospholipase D family protein [Pseudomonadota bacterium]